MQHRTFFGGRVAEIPATLRCDPRGMLTAIQFGNYDFLAVRAFVVTAPPGAIRGGHAHRLGRQVMMQLSGEIDIEVRYREQVGRLSLNESNRAVLIESGVWAQQTYQGENPSLLVFCDSEYDPEDYIEDYS